MTGCLVADVRLCDLTHLNCGLYTHVYTALLQSVLQCQRVNRGSQHTHIVCTGALHLSAAVLDAAPEIAAADNDADFRADFYALFDNVANRTDDVKVQTELVVARQCFATDFD